MSTFNRSLKRIPDSVDIDRADWPKVLKLKNHTDEDGVVYKVSKNLFGKVIRVSIHSFPKHMQ